MDNEVTGEEVRASVNAKRERFEARRIVDEPDCGKCDAYRAMLRWIDAQETRVVFRVHHGDEKRVYVEEAGGRYVEYELRGEGADSEAALRAALSSDAPGGDAAESEEASGDEAE